MKLFNWQIGIQQWVIRVRQFLCRHESYFGIRLDIPTDYPFAYLRCINCDKLLHQSEGFTLEMYINGARRVKVLD